MSGPGGTVQQGRPVYSISAVARMLDVPVATLRTWEDRYGQVVPARNASGHRLFSRYQVEQLAFVRAQMSEGASAADAHRLLAERAETGLPLVPPAARPAPRLLILLVESDPYAAEFEEYFLTTEGFEVGVTLGEDAARSAFASAAPAVVIIEVLISGGEGLALCRSFREQNGVAIIVVSAVDVTEQAFDAGADAFLRKPLDPLQLVSTVRDLLRSSAFLAPVGASVD
ncbi:MAG TPA: MerR family transcriptional regulator [Streptosporangiaceae bacterium]|nr:MerR family transcriptional regulator [Streptosporangiaceae bacterium]